MREEIHYQYAKFTLVSDHEDKGFVLYASDTEFRVVANKRFDNEVDFKETIRSLKRKLQELNDEIKELKNG